MLTEQEHAELTEDEQAEVRRRNEGLIEQQQAEAQRRKREREDDDDMSFTADKVQEALQWIPPELGMLKSNELLPIQEDIQMATTCVSRIAAAEVRLPNTGGVVPSSFGVNPADGKPFSFCERLEA